MQRRTHHLALAAALPALALVSASLADHIPGHDDDDPVFPVPLPGQGDFSGGAAWVSAIGPIGGTEIINARFDITWVSDGATPASNLLLNLTQWIDLGEQDIVQVETVVTGADLGFGSGPGTFHGTFETTDLNGVAVENFLVAPYSILDVIIDATTGGGIQGTAYFVDSFIYFDMLTESPTCPWDLDGDADVGFGDLLALLSVWGTDPGGAPDFDGDGDVGFSDLLALLAAWGPCP